MLHTTKKKAVKNFPAIQKQILGLCLGLLYTAQALPIPLTGTVLLASTVLSLPFTQMAGTTNRVKCNTMSPYQLGSSQGKSENGCFVTSSYS